MCFIHEVINTFTASGKKRKIKWVCVWFFFGAENLVPNIFLELFFVMQLLTSQSPHTNDGSEQESDSAAKSGAKLVFMSFKSYNKYGSWIVIKIFS